jgi:hypothetical protein
VNDRLEPAPVSVEPDFHRARGMTREYRPPIVDTLHALTNISDIFILPIDGLNSDEKIPRIRPLSFISEKFALS